MKSVMLYTQEENEQIQKALTTAEHLAEKVMKLPEAYLAKAIARDLRRDIERLRAASPVG